MFLSNVCALFDTIMKQKYTKRQSDNTQSVEFFTEQGMPRAFAEVLCARGVTEQNHKSFFGESFHSPFEMKNMREAAETISFLLEEGGSVLICGDYDADGLTASSILSLFFTDNGVDNDVIIPTRDEGYGLHADLVFKAFEKKFYDLIITVDCGISNREEVAKIIEELDAEIIVTDHHELPEVLPDCLCVNPKMGYPFPNLAGAGVAWKLVEALAGREVAANYSELAMIGTVGDMMPMLDENRSIVQMGLANRNHKSLKKLTDLSRCPEKLTVNDVAMRIAPKINAAGRVGEPQIALKLLLSRDKTDAETANALLKLNEQRKGLVDALIADADARLDEAKIRRERIVFLCGDWPHGIVGIAAARYKEKYNLPAAVLTRDGDVFVGSARGVDGVDLFEVFSACSDLLDKFGGHKASVGFSVSEENVEKLNGRLSEILCSFGQDCFEKKFFYDVDLDDMSTVEDCYKFSQTLQPLLPQEKLLFRVCDSVKFASTFGKDNQHLSVVLNGGLELKSFYKNSEYAPFVTNGANVEALISLEYDDYSKRVYGIIEDIHLLNSVCFDRFYKLNFLRNFEAKNEKCVEKTQVENVLREDSVLVVFDDYATYLEQCEVFDLDDFFVDIFFESSPFSKTVVISPNADYRFAKYDKVVYFCNDGALRDLPQNAVYFAVHPANKQLYSLQLNREICVAAYSKLKKKGSFESIKSVFDKYLTGSMDYEQYIVALRVFQQLGFIKIVDKFTVEFLPTQKNDLENSSVFKYFAQ